MKWTSLHIYHTGNTVGLMQNCLSPLIDSMSKDAMAKSFFFILYNERGSHVRLRIKSDVSQELVIRFANERIYEYFRQNPSYRHTQRNPGDFPDDSIQIQNYEPEYDRYGGEKGIEIAEEHFYFSSMAAIRYLSQLDSREDNYSNLLNCAFKLHLATAYVYLKDLDTSILFFRNVFNSFIGNSSRYLLSFTFKEEGKYNQHFEFQKAELVPYVGAIWNSFLDGDVIDDVMEDWKEHEKKTSVKLQEAYSDNILSPAVVFSNDPAWYILQSYMHMTNNRLGINRTDEGMIAYLLMRSLMEI